MTLSRFFTFARRAFSRFDPTAWVVGITSRIAEYVADRKREARIRALRSRLTVAFAARDEQSVRDIARHMFAECDARSPRQVARLERRALAALDPHAREALGR